VIGEVTLGADVSVWYSAVVPGDMDATRIGMGAAVLNGASVGDGSLIAAGSVVSQVMQVPPGSLVAGVPANVKRELSEAEVEHIRTNAAAYVELARIHTAAEPV
jgi:carbonic anhydrase/acetyltransferase-like protein (isoleucine patch superfamily)